mmetsp:Transcript_17226/g.22379  ORF Transcript_17226/g.22379 Transcript_17226/m.22379 type:complete len:261 (+) Transcript_17226:882-1664(+)
MFRKKNIFPTTLTKRKNIFPSKFIISSTLQPFTVDKCPISTTQVHQVRFTPNFTFRRFIGHSSILQHTMLLTQRRMLNKHICYPLIPSKQVRRLLTHMQHINWVRIFIILPKYIQSPPRSWRSRICRFSKLELHTLIHITSLLIFSKCPRQSKISLFLWFLFLIIRHRLSPFPPISRPSWPFIIRDIPSAFSIIIVIIIITWTIVAVSIIIIIISPFTRSMIRILLLIAIAVAPSSFSTSAAVALLIGYFFGIFTSFCGS